MYLQDLTLRLGSGLAHMPESWRANHAAYLRAAQRSDGGFSGREGGSDLYYTSFALRSLALLGLVEGQVAERAAGFLKMRLAGQVRIVDFLSLIYSAVVLNLAAGLDVFASQPASWRPSVAATLEQLRRADGGYAKTAEGQASSMYHSFLVVLCQQLIGQPTPAAPQLTEFVRSRRREDGGFVEMNPMKRSGTNPTAAAIGLLKIFAGLDDATRDGTIAFLAQMQTDEGGLRANTRERNGRRGRDARRSRSRGCAALRRFATITRGRVPWRGLGSGPRRRIHLLWPGRHRACGRLTP